MHALVPTSILWDELWNSVVVFFHPIFINKIDVIGADEEGTLAVLKGHRRELIDPLIDQHREADRRAKRGGRCAEQGWLEDEPGAAQN